MINQFQKRGYNKSLIQQQMDKANLLECTKCKIQNVGKAETEFNIRLNNHRKDAWKSEAIAASLLFSDKSHDFNTHTKVILIE